MQQQQNTPPTLSRYPHYQPAANDMLQQQHTIPQQQHVMPPYPYSMYPPMPMWQQSLNNVTNTYQQQGETRHKQGGGSKCKRQHQQQQYQPNINKYCWTHGGCNHFGSNYKYPAQGHQNNATSQNKMG
eukprot:15325350-Ditylum_brightwellii.AAC.1